MLLSRMSVGQSAKRDLRPEEGGKRKGEGLRGGGGYVLEEVNCRIRLYYDNNVTMPDTLISTFCIFPKPLATINNRVGTFCLRLVSMRPRLWSSNMNFEEGSKEEPTKTNKNNISILSSEESSSLSSGAETKL